MPFRDMRDYLAALEQQNLLERVSREVDHNWEIACLAKWMYQALPIDRRFGLYFQNVKGTQIPVVTGALGASPASVAVALQCDVGEINQTVVNLPYGHDEIELAGGLKGEPIELVRCKTIDLAVPANAEIIVEAEIAPGERDDEGPFGEFAGYMGQVEKRPVARVTAITHRREPIFYGYTSQMPPSESTTIQSLMNAGVILQTLRDYIGEQSVQDVWIDLTFGGLLAHGIVAMTPQFPGHGKRVGRAIADTTLLKRITVVDTDVDIRDSTHVDWALNSRFSPQRDTVIIDDVYVPLLIDPSVRDARGNVWQGSKLILDATQKINSGPFSLPPKEMMAKALMVWKECGLPEFDIPRRAKLRLDKS